MDEKTQPVPHAQVPTAKPQAITLTPSVLKEREEWNLIKEQARVAVTSGFLPESIKTPEQAAIIALKGKELGIPIMQALSSISVIKGKPALSSELMLALIRSRVKGAVVIFKTPPEKANHECEIEATRLGHPAQVFKFTLEDAKRAGLTSNPAWGKYPAAMLRARCISSMARAVFPEATMACLTPEELGGDEGEEIGVIEAECIKSIKIEPKPVKEPG